MTERTTSLRRDEAGASAVEFGLLAPVIIAMLVAAVQFGIALQNYNALRSVAADVVRTAMVEYGNGNRLNTNQLRNYALSVGRATPYMLESSRMTATVQTASVQRVSGATELTLEVRYRVPLLFAGMGLEGPSISYSTPIFLVDQASAT